MSALDDLGKWLGDANNIKELPNGAQEAVTKYAEYLKTAEKPEDLMTWIGRHAATVKTDVENWYNKNEPLKGLVDKLKSGGDGIWGALGGMFSTTGGIVGAAVGGIGLFAAVSMMGGGTIFAIIAALLGVFLGAGIGNGISGGSDKTKTDGAGNKQPPGGNAPQVTKSPLLQATVMSRKVDTKDEAVAKLNALRAVFEKGHDKNSVADVDAFIAELNKPENKDGHYALIGQQNVGLAIVKGTPAEGNKLAATHIINVVGGTSQTRELSAAEKRTFEVAAGSVLTPEKLQGQQQPTAVQLVQGNKPLRQKPDRTTEIITNGVPEPFPIINENNGEVTWVKVVKSKSGKYDQAKIVAVSQGISDGNNIRLGPKIDAPSDIPSIPVDDNGQILTAKITEQEGKLNEARKQAFDKFRQEVRAEVLKGITQVTGKANDINTLKGELAAQKGGNAKQLLGELNKNPSLLDPSPSKKHVLLKKEAVYFILSGHVNSDGKFVVESATGLQKDGTAVTTKAEGDDPPFKLTPGGGLAAAPSMGNPLAVTKPDAKTNDPDAMTKELANKYLAGAFDHIAIDGITLAGVGSAKQAGGLSGKPAGRTA